MASFVLLWAFFFAAHTVAWVSNLQVYFGVNYFLLLLYQDVQEGHSVVDGTLDCEV